MLLNRQCPPGTNLDAGVRRTNDVRIAQDYPLKKLSPAGSGPRIAITTLVALWLAMPLATIAGSSTAKVDFNREIRPILSANCYKCHGPDDEARKAKLRFDLPAEALKPAKSGATAIVPGSPEKSELIARITAKDEDDRMPPIKSGKQLTQAQIELLRRWIAEGARAATHWAYTRPVRPSPPVIKNKRWPINEIDRFILARLEKEGLKPSAPADSRNIIRRLSLNLTGLPPTSEEVTAFVNDKRPNAYERLVDRLLAKKAFGEHWARMWLDLARYADSAGYADDPLRTIWEYRDYVIKAFNKNKPFDRFTVEQIAGDLLDDADEDDLVATAFHRNTMTNNEGGTNDEEFRNAAVVDRVNTTMAVWMATSIGCAQCHTHKYDPISQREYFRFFAFFNNTKDADLTDESPLLEIYSPEQKQTRKKLDAEVQAIESRFKDSSAEAFAAESKWEVGISAGPQWETLTPARLQAKEGGAIAAGVDSTIKIAPQQKYESYTVQVDKLPSKLTALRIAALPSPQSGSAADLNGYSIIHIKGRLLLKSADASIGRYVRVELPGKDRILSLAEVQVFSGSNNVALKGSAEQSSTAFEGPGALAIDGNTDGDYEKARSTSHTESSENPWWEVDLQHEFTVQKIVIWNRTDNELQKRLGNFKIQLLNDKRDVVWQQLVKPAPNPSATFGLDGTSSLAFSAVFSDSQLDAELKSVINPEIKSRKGGWEIESGQKTPHYLTLFPEKPIEISAGARLELTIEQEAQRVRPTAALIKMEATSDPRISDFAAIPENILALVTMPESKRNAQEKQELLEFYRRNLAPELAKDRERLTAVKKELGEIKPVTVPIMREMAADHRRKTHMQFRGNYLALGDEVREGVPAAFPSLPSSAPLDRLTLARWLVDEQNPLTARVIVNRFWEQIFGVGIVRTTEDFGSQGDLPTHPELLDWLATEFVSQKWDVKKLLKEIVMSAAYRQSSRVTPDLAERDPENLLLARGPRFRMPAEEVRDQALAVSGLLSEKMYGPPIRPPRPTSGLTAAFGSSLDWKTSEGEDRYRRAIYIEWRRTSPYPSMATFDAPNREVCTLRRPRSNTPLQALVTLNDPVYVEAAQALARRIVSAAGTAEQKAAFGFQLCLSRTPRAAELEQIVRLQSEAKAGFEKEPAKALQMIGGKKQNTDPSQPNELAAWTVVGNVLLNLDEMLVPP